MLCPQQSHGECTWPAPFPQSSLPSTGCLPLAVPPHTVTCLQHPYPEHPVTNRLPPVTVSLPRRTVIPAHTKGEQGSGGWKSPRCRERETLSNCICGPGQQNSSFPQHLVVTLLTIETYHKKVIRPLHSPSGKQGSTTGPGTHHIKEPADSLTRQLQS